MSRDLKLEKVKEIDITDKFPKPHGFKYVSDLAIDQFSSNVLLILSQGKDAPAKIGVYDSELNEIICEESKKLLGVADPSAAFYSHEGLVVGNSDTSSLHFFNPENYTVMREPLQLINVKEEYSRPYLQQVVGKNDGTLYVLMQFPPPENLLQCEPDKNIVERYKKISFRCITKDNENNNIYGVNDLGDIVIQSIKPDGSVANLVTSKNFGVFVHGLGVDSRQRFWVHTYSKGLETGVGTHNKLRYYDKEEGTFRKAFRKIGDIRTFGIDRDNNLFICHSVYEVGNFKLMFAKYKIIG